MLVSVFNKLKVNNEKDNHTNKNYASNSNFSMQEKVIKALEFSIMGTAYLSGSIPVAANAAIAFEMISLTTLCRFRDKYRPWEAKHMTNFISKYNCTN